MSSRWVVVSYISRRMTACSREVGQLRKTQFLTACGKIVIKCSIITCSATSCAIWAAGYSTTTSVLIQIQLPTMCP